jgi:hypothetical protein
MRPTITLTSSAKLPKNGRLSCYICQRTHPNLNLIERFWKSLKRKVTRNRFYATFAEFRSAVQKVLNNITAYRDGLTTLMIERFQLFTAP